MHKNTTSPLLIEALAKTYITKQRHGLFKSEQREVDALVDVSLEVKPGEIFGLLGPNGAGKTTLIKILTTLLLPTKGAAWVNGWHVEREPNQVRASVGCMLMGERGLYWKLTGRENLVYFGALYHLDPQTRAKRAQEIIDLLDLKDIAERTVETYSSGQKMKLAFGKALVNDAPLLILDEPTNTLDVPSASELRAIVRKLNAAGKTIIYTTHIMAEAETLCNRVAIIDHGKLLAVDTVETLKSSLEKEQITRVEGIFPEKAVQELRSLKMITKATLSSEESIAKLTLVTSNGRDTLPKMIDVLVSNGAVIQKIVPQETTLEDVFIAKTGRTLADDTRTR